MKLRGWVVVSSVVLLLGLALLSVQQWALYRQQLMNDELHREIAQLRDEVARQREMLREQTLKTTRRSVDEFLALFPAKFPAGNWQPAETQFEDCWFTSTDGLRLHAWHLRHPRPQAVILHVHGNAGNLSHRAEVAQLLRERSQVSVMIFDYRGYGRSEGIPTMAGILLDARAARSQLAQREGIAESDVVLLGESLGGAVAVDLAAEDDAGGLILESTFSSLRDVAGQHYPRMLVSLIVADKLNSSAKISKYRGPLLQVHGDADGTVPLESARKLFAAANEPKTLIVLPAHDHNDPLPVSYYAAVDRFLKDR